MRATFKCLMLAVVIAACCGSLIAADQVPYKVTLASTKVDFLPPGIPGNDCPNYIVLPDNTTVPLPEDGTLGIFKMTITAVGNSTLMGLTADVQSHCVPMPMAKDAPLPDIGTEVPFFNGTATLTGANGDKIFGKYFGVMTVTAGGMVIEGMFTTIDGTGRFAKAKGFGKAFGVQSFLGDSAAMTITGTMTSAGAVKK